MTPLPDVVNFTTNAGDHESLALSHDWSADVADAVRLDHDCDSPSCDICEALRVDFPLSAAYLLHGATETPALDAVRAAYVAADAIPEDNDFVTLDADSDDWLGWVAHHREYARTCPSCNGVTYAGDMWEPETCANCGASIVRDYVFVAVIPYKSNREPSLAYDEFCAAPEIEFDSLLFFGGPYNATPEMIHDANYDVRLRYQTRDLDVAEDGS